MQVNPNPAVQQFVDSAFKNAAGDGRITGREARQLNETIDQMGLSNADKDALKNMVKELKEASNGQFLFFSWKSKITPEEMTGLQNLAQSNGLAQQLLSAFQEAEAASAPQPSQTDPTAQSSINPNAYQEAGFDANSQTFNTGNTGSTSGITAPLASDRGVPPWIVSQNGTGLESAGGDCGPASAAMIARRFGFQTEKDSRGAVLAAREAGGQVGRNSSGGYALGEDQVSRAVVNMTGGQVRETGRESFPAGQSQGVRDMLKARLDAGDLPILLTGSPSDQSEFRHYMVVTEVKPNGNLVMADPAGGRVWEMTPAMLESLMEKADGRVNPGTTVMSFNR
ncbi:MAG: hypothetical protein ACO1RX_18430 [Candidatus Sericytochromatia bacterium]